MAGSTLSQLLDFAEGTGAFSYTGINDLVNEAQYNKYGLRWLLSGSDMNRIQGGLKIRDDIMLDAGNTGTHYLPGFNRTYSNPAVLTRHETEWRFYENHMMFLEQEQDLQGVGNMTRSARFQVFKDVLAAKRQRMATNVCNDMENALFAEPNVTTQDGTGTLAVNPTSIFTMVNEYQAASTTGATGLSYTSDGKNNYGSATPSGFTTIQNLNPATNAGWRPWQCAFNASAAAVTSATVNAGANPLYDAFDLVSEILEIEELPWNPSAGSTPNPIPEDYIIMCSLKAKTFASKLSRSAQNYFRMSSQDPRYGTISFAGAPFRFFSAMNSAAVYPTSGTAAPAVGAGVVEDSGSAAKAGPRYIWASKQWLRPFFHSDHNFTFRPEFPPSAQPDVKIKTMNTWYNYFCRSRRKFAIVYPANAMSGY